MDRRSHAEVDCFIVRDANGQALTYIYYESEPGRLSVAKSLSEDRGAADCGEYRQPAGAPYSLKVLFFGLRAGLVARQAQAPQTV